MRNIFLGSLCVALVALLLTPLLLASPAASVQGAPALAPTPVVFSNNGLNTPRLLTWYSAASVGASERNCFDLQDRSVVDLQWVTNQTMAITVTLQHSNDNSNFVSGPTLVSASATPASGLQQYPLYGRWQCIYVQKANATPATITVIGVAK